MNRLEPRNVLRALAELLQQRGITRLYGSAGPQLGVLSVADNLTVWTDGRLLWWQQDGENINWPAADPDGAAARLAAIVRPPEPSSLSAYYYGMNCLGTIMA